MEPRDMDRKHNDNRVRVPDVQLPAREARLRRGIMALARQSHAHRSPREVFAMKPRLKIAASLVAAIAVAGSVAAFMVAGPAAGLATAVATFEVNPAFSITVDADREVVDVITHNEDAKALLKGLDLEGAPLQEAVAVITVKLTEAGYVVPDNEIAVVVHPTGDGTDDNVADVAAGLESWLRDTTGQGIAVVVVTLSAEDFTYLEDNGLLPGDYANIVADTGTIELIRRLVAMNEAFGNDGELTADKFGTIVEAANEMVEVGITQDAAFRLIEAAVAAGFDLENISELADVYEELADIGLSGAGALGLMERAIAAGLGTDDLWDMADLHLELRERGMSFEDALALIYGQIAAGWSADAVDEYADIFEAMMAGESEIDDEDFDDDDEDDDVDDDEGDDAGSDY